MHRLAINDPIEAVGLASEIDHLAEVDVERSVLDAERDGVGNHLHLQALLAGDGGEGDVVGGDAAEFLDEAVGAELPRDLVWRLLDSEEAGEQTITRSIEARYLNGEVSLISRTSHFGVEVREMGRLFRPQLHYPERTSTTHAADSDGVLAGLDPSDAL